jgi:hypothetical protein
MLAQPSPPGDGDLRHSCQTTGRLSCARCQTRRGTATCIARRSRVLLRPTRLDTRGCLQCAIIPGSRSAQPQARPCQSSKVQPATTSNSDPHIGAPGSTAVMGEKHTSVQRMQPAGTACDAADMLVSGSTDKGCRCPRPRLPCCTPPREGTVSTTPHTHTTQHDRTRQPGRDGSKQTQGTGVLPVTIHSCGRAFTGNKRQGDSPAM